VTLDALNGAGRAEFVRLLGGVFEHSPWVVERAWVARPFASVHELHRAMTEVVRQASREEQVRLLRAHPDLAGKAARAGTMTDFSKGEQGVAGLDRLTDEVRSPRWPCCSPRATGPAACRCPGSLR
jgi:OHCU decarboxylase